MIHRSCLWIVFVIGNVATSAHAIPPDYSVENGEVKLRGVAPDNPMLYDNDWWFDGFDNNYLWAQT